MRNIYVFLMALGILAGTARETLCQKFECGTMVTTDQKDLEGTLTIPGGTPTQSLPQLHRTLAISIFIVKNDSGKIDVSYSHLLTAIANLNQYFKPIDVSFKICDTTHIPNYQLNNISASGNEAEVVAQFHKKNTINLYIAANLTDQGGNNVHAYTYMPSANKDLIFLDKASILGTRLAHQMGHFLNLYHTHENAFGVELVNQTNCATAGDICCDTDADPNIVGQVNDDCVYTGSAKDSNNAFYHPKPKNIMSFGTDVCRCNLSQTQYLRVIYTLSNLKKDLR